MRHAWAAALVVLVVGVLPARAEVIEGQIKDVDAAKGVLVVTVGEKDKEFQVPATAKVQINDIRGIRDAEGGLKDKDVIKGFRVKITTEEKDGKVVIKEVLVHTGRKADG